MATARTIPETSAVERKGNNLYYALAGGYAAPKLDYVNTVGGSPDKEDDHPGYLMPIRIYADLSACRQYNAHNTNIPSLRVVPRFWRPL